ncbi:MAG: hypothetical protein ABL888_03935 [Pirellulaceae bacterium]
MENLQRCLWINSRSTLRVEILKSHASEMRATILDSRVEFSKPSRLGDACDGISPGNFLGFSLHASDGLLLTKTMFVTNISPLRIGKGRDECALNLPATRIFANRGRTHV